MSDETQIRQLVETWAQAVRDGDMETILNTHTKDIVMFDVPPPLQRRGQAEYKQSWDLYYQFTPGGDDTFNILKLELFIGDDVAYGITPLHVANDTARLTLGFRKEGDIWLIAHEHHSFPVE